MAQNQYSAADNFDFNNIPDPTAEEMAAPAAHSAREVGGAAHGQSAQVAKLEAELGEDAAPAAEVTPAEEPAADAAGPQTEEWEEEAAEVDAPAPAPAWDAAAWDAADFDKPERLAEVPEAYRPVVTMLAAAAGARVVASEERFAAQLDAGVAVERQRVDGVVAGLAELRDKRLLPILERLENAGVADAEKILDDFTRAVNEAGQRSEREAALEREVAVMRWRDFARDVPEGDKLLALAKRGDLAAKAAVKDFGDLANKVGFRDAWDITAKRHKAVVGKLAPAAPAAPAPAAAAPAAPPPARPAVAPPARPPAAPVQPPTRMAPRVAPPPPVQQRASVRAPAVDDDALLTAGWDEFKRGR